MYIASIPPSVPGESCSVVWPTTPDIDLFWVELIVAECLLGREELEEFGILLLRIKLCPLLGQNLFKYCKIGVLHYLLHVVWLGAVHG
jgi:hypothetical protein